MGELLRRDEIDFVQDLDDGLGGDIELSEHFFHLRLLLLARGAGGILNVE